MMRMRVGLKHVLNDPVSLIYTPVIFSLICLHFKQLYWLPPRVRISCCSIIIHVGLNDDLQPWMSGRQATVS